MKNEAKKTCMNRSCKGFYCFWKLKEKDKYCPYCNEKLVVKKSSKAIDNLDKLKPDEAKQIQDGLVKCVSIIKEMVEMRINEIRARVG